MNLVALALDDELKRVAGEENLTMDEIVKQVAGLIKCSTRQIHNFRTGKWALSTAAIPVLCQRFKSQMLLSALKEDCSSTPVEVPDAYDLARLVTQTVREDMEHYSGFLAAFESDGIDSGELKQLIASGARVVQNVRQFEAIAMADHARRAERTQVGVTA